ncbi:MAG: hypothetical protein KDA78_20590, partial [Planctomycetaceae bacterium]|nr:hypothetical protein [Planctomycetaceae bacterium]
FHGKAYVGKPNDFDLKKFASVDNLTAALEDLKQGGGNSPGIDGIRLHDFGYYEWFSFAHELSSSILERSYQPQPVREVPIPKSAGGTRILSIPTVRDRIVAKALHTYLYKHFKKKLRLRSVPQILIRLEFKIRQTNHFWIAPDDVENCYPSVLRKNVMDSHAHFKCNDDLLHIIRTIVYGNEIEEERGLRQGCPYSALALDIHLHHILEMDIHRSFKEVELCRYADNLIYLCESETQAHAVLAHSNSLLQEHGMQLKRKDGPPCNLENPRAQIQILGLLTRWGESGLEYSIPETKFEELRDNLREAPSPHNAWKRCNGWIQSMGPALSTSPEVTFKRIADITLELGLRNIQKKAIRSTMMNAMKAWKKEINSWRRQWRAETESNPQNATFPRQRPSTFSQ